MRKAVCIVLCLLLALPLSGCFESAQDRRDREVAAAEEGYRDGYQDGLRDASAAYEDGFAAGYAEGHREAQSHSERYEELLRQAYEATGGKGAGFKEEDGMIFVEETTPSGREVWVIFEP